MMISAARRRFENSRGAVFVSGRGSNLQALLNQPEEFRVVLVVSNKRKAPAVTKARRAGVPVFIFDSKASWDELSLELRRHRVSLIFLLGFMKILPESFCHEWQGRLLNVHPSMLPLHPGLHGFEKSFETKSPLGATIHEVIAEMDAGPKLFQWQFASWEFENGPPQDLEIERKKLTFTEHRLVRESGRRCL